MKLCYLLLICGIFPINLIYAQDSTEIKMYPQRDFIEVLYSIFNKEISKPKDSLEEKNIIFSFLPMVNNVGDNSSVVISINSTFFLGDQQNTKMSSISIIPYTNTSRQVVIPIRSYIYTKKNKYNFTGDYRFMRYPQKTYGLGSNNYKDYQSIVYYNQWRIYQFISREWNKDLRFGGGLQMDNYYNIIEVSNTNNTSDFSNYTNSNSTNQKSFGLTAQILYDSRKNIINPEDGAFVEIDFRLNTPLIGSSSKWNSIYVDLRKYYSLSSIKHKIIALRSLYWTILSGSPYYLDLPSIGWDSYGTTGRGFTKNRFRSNALTYFEGEFRTDITNNGLLGAVFFSNISSVSDLHTQRFSNWHPAIGAGIRIKWRKENSSNMVLDYGISKDDWSIRIGLSENF